MKYQKVTPEIEKKWLEEALKLSAGDAPVALHALGQGALNLAWFLSKRLKNEIEYQLQVINAHEANEDCGQEGCQTCCPHSDARDHGICIDCGQEEDPGAAIDRAYDRIKDGD